MLSTCPKFIGYFHLQCSKLVSSTCVTLLCVFISAVCDVYLGEIVGFGIKIDLSVYSLDRTYMYGCKCRIFVL